MRVALVMLIPAMSVVGCTRPTAPPLDPVPYSATRLGMTVAEAEAACGGPGKGMAHDDLPIDPKPQHVYKKLPADVQWLYWGDRGNAAVILGVREGKVVARMTHHVLTGKFEWDGEAKAEYQ